MDRGAWWVTVVVQSLSRVRLLATPWTTGYQAPPSKGFSRQKYWSGVPLPSPQSFLGCPIFSSRLKLPGGQGLCLVHLCLSLD